MVKINGRKVKGIKKAVGLSNSSEFPGVIFIDLTELPNLLVTFHHTRPDYTYFSWPGVIELHKTGAPHFIKTSMKQIEAQITAHILTYQESGLTAEDYAREWDLVGSGQGDSLLQLYNKQLDSLTQEEV